jgi:hypothetical protein
LATGFGNAGKTMPSSFKRASAPMISSSCGGFEVPRFFSESGHQVM